MANRTPGITEKFMEQVLQEFLTHGYTDPSLRTIAEKVGTSPRAVYTRYGDKEGLFAALVSEQADTLKALFRNDMETYHAKPVDEQKQLIHLLCSSFVHGFFEFVRHDIPKDAAVTYIAQLQMFFACGWEHLLRP